MLLWIPSREATIKLLKRNKGRRLYAREFNEFQKIADELMMRWSYELAQPLFTK